MTLATRFAKARIDAGLTPAELARRMGVTRQAIDKIENGETKNLRMENLFEAARILRVRAEWLGIGKGPQADIRIAEDAADYAAGLLSIQTLAVALEYLEQCVPAREWNKAPAEQKAKWIAMLYGLALDESARGLDARTIMHLLNSA